MPFGKDQAIIKAREFLSILRSNGVDISEAYLFGSALMDHADEESDIDLAIVSKEFTGLPFYDVKKISKFRRLVDTRLEIHPFSFDDVLKNPPLFFLKIKMEGLPLN
jgi:uncharacterized protein